MKTKLLFTLFLSLGVSSTTHSAIIHTDINPDATTTLDPNVGSAFSVVAIDFNNDGTKEFDFRWDDYSAFGGGWYMHMTPDGTNAEFILKGTAVNPFGGRYIDPLVANTVIDATGNWGTSMPEPFIGDDSDPNFQGVGDRYVGVKFDLAGSTHYGWVLVSFDASKTLIVKEYAYEDVAGTSIEAGQTTSGSTASLSMNLLNDVNVYPNPSSDYIVVDQFSIYDQVKIFTMDARLMYEGELTNSKTVIDVSGFDQGAYKLILSTKQGTRIETKALIIE